MEFGVESGFRGETLRVRYLIRLLRRLLAEGKLLPPLGKAIKRVKI